MTTPADKRPRGPYLTSHVRDHAEPARDAAMRIQEEVRAIIEIASTAAESEDADPWRAFARAIGHVATIGQLGALVVRELESIKGMGRPEDADGLRLVDREG